MNTHASCLPLCSAFPSLQIEPFMPTSKFEGCNQVNIGAFEIPLGWAALPCRWSICWPKPLVWSMRRRLIADVGRIQVQRVWPNQLPLELVITHGRSWHQRHCQWLGATTHEALLDRHLQADVDVGATMVSQILDLITLSRNTSVIRYSTDKILWIRKGPMIQIWVRCVFPLLLLIKHGHNPSSHLFLNCGITLYVKIYIPK